MYILNTIFRLKIFRITKQSYFCFLLLSWIYYIQYNRDSYQNNHDWADDHNNSINSHFRNFFSLKIKEICSIWENSQIPFVKVSYYISNSDTWIRTRSHTIRLHGMSIKIALILIEYNSYFSHYNECIFCENAFIILFY